jgi:DNA polymerase III subunit epsilon
MLPRAIIRLLYPYSLRDPSYRFLFQPSPADEVVAFDCETTGLNPRRDDIITVAAVRIRGNRIMTSERFEAIARPQARLNVDAIKLHRLREMDVSDGSDIRAILPAFLRFVGGRPLVGYYVSFDVRMVDKYLRSQIGIGLPNRLIEISRLYYERKYSDAPPGTTIDLSFAAILDDLDLPRLDQHDALNDALMTAIMYVQLRDFQRRGIRIPRQVHRPQAMIA